MRERSREIAGRNMLESPQFKKKKNNEFQQPRSSVDSKAVA